MPELPEMQGLAERLGSALTGATLSGVEPLQFSALKTVLPPADAALGHSVESVTRRGKYLLFDFVDGPRMIVHLSQGGRVDLEETPKRTRPKGAVVRLRFDGGPDVLVKEFGTERKAAWWVLERGDDGPLDGLGPEPFSDEFASLIRTGVDKRRIHTMLRDQRTVAGVGRGHTDDILHRAQLSPYATLASLSADERERLLTAVRDVLDDALGGERKRTGGLPTKLSDRFVVHGRAGRPCPRCGDDLRRVSYESHEVVYCPTCQTGGKVLADRRLSRLIR
ncbi:MAG: Fpg/Nei family DNA glycosylase [Acidimicrobiia bacterium]|nr:Fpg/Nei family DNA glycosylase [Acidimicrobiia bacterium]